MLASQLNLACASFRNIDELSLHTANPGITGANDSGIAKKSVTWSAPANGAMSATVTFTAITGSFTHIGLWDGPVFIEGRPLNVSIPTAQNLTVLVEFSAAAAQ